MTPVNGFGSAVSFACSGLPAGATCSFAPATVTPSGAAATTQLTISASEPVFYLAAGIPTILPVHSAGCDGLLLRMEKAASLASLAAAGGSLRRPGASLWLRREQRGGVTPTPTPTPTPTSTTSTVTVTATSGTLQGTATITLTVN